MASDQAFLASAVAKDTQLPLDAKEAEIVISCRGDGGINDIPALPLIEGVARDDERVVTLTNVARGRLDAFIKYAGYCEAEELVPVLPSPVYGTHRRYLPMRKTSLRPHTLSRFGRSGIGCLSSATRSFSSTAGWMNCQLRD